MSSILSSSSPLLTNFIVKVGVGREGRGREGHDESEEGMVEGEESDGGLALFHDLTTDFFLQ